MTKLNKTPINFRYNTRTITASETLTEDDDYLLVDTSSGAVTLTLPPVDAAIIVGQVIKIKLIDATNSLTIDGDGSETIDGSTTFVMTVLNEAYEFVSDGTEWWVF